jgi:hypothetical protein
MELQLWHWSTLAQLASALAIAAYFVALSLSVRRAELHAWVTAWLSNLAAIGVAIAFSLLHPQSALLVPFFSAAYFFAKTQFVTLLVAGATHFALEKPRPVPHGPLSIAIAVLSILIGIAVGSLDRVGMIQSITMGAILIAGAMLVGKTKAPGSGWLATGFVLRMVLATAETDAYAVRSMLGHAPGPGWVSTFMTLHSAFDAGAECVIALGCALTLRGWIAQQHTASG